MKNKILFILFFSFLLVNFSSAKDIALNNEEEVNIFNQAVSFYNSNNYNAVIKAINVLLEKNPNIAEAYNLRGNAYYSIGEYDLAVKDFTEAIKIDVKFSDAYKSRAESYRLQKKYDLA
ncbi:MAG: tetratricopeptide repeat protein, partial [Bacteroidetes bacterium]|nr:tetratricopeptide repeat protein [Bacteroidota bacterium]